MCEYLLIFGIWHLQRSQLKAPEAQCVWLVAMCHLTLSNLIQVFLTNHSQTINSTVSMQRTLYFNTWMYAETWQTFYMSRTNDHVCNSIRRQWRGLGLEQCSTVSNYSYNMLNREKAVRLKQITASLIRSIINSLTQTHTCDCRGLWLLLSDDRVAKVSQVLQATVDVKICRKPIREGNTIYVTTWRAQRCKTSPKQSFTIDTHIHWQR